MTGKLRSLTFRVTIEVVVALVLGLAAVALARPATADPNPPTPTDGVVTLPGGVACPFPVELQFTGKVKTIELPGGRTLYTSPAFNLVATNLSSPGHSVSLAIPGAFHVSTEPNGEVVTVVTGRNLLINPGELVLVVGRFHYRFDAAGNLLESFSGRGQVFDVCEMLA